MSLLALIAGAVVGSFFVGSGESKSKSQTSSNNSVVRVNYNYSQPTSDNYKRYNDTPKKESVYDNKIEFFDKYREIDNYLASLIGLEYKGITYFISGAVGRGKTDYYYDDEWWDMIKTLRRIREYRNMLGHDKSKWQSLPDPDPSYVKYLRSFGANVYSNRTKMSNIVEEGYYYLKSLG